MPVTRKLLKILPPVLGVLVLGGVVVGLHGALHKVGMSDVLAALAATPRVQVLRAALLLVLSMSIMAGYDVPGIWFARRRGDVPRLGTGRIALVSLCAYALSHVLGAAALSAAAIRLRLYAQWEVPAGGIARIVGLCATNFTLGLLTVLGTLLATDPSTVPVAGNAAPDTLRVVGLALVAVPLAYVGMSLRLDHVRVLGREIELPGVHLALAQIALSCTDICIAGALFYAVLPAAPGLDYPHALGLYLGAYAAGVFSGLPGGVGVFDSVLLLGLSAYLPPASALGAILLFRVMYFLVPACLGGISYAGHELWVQARRAKGDGT